MSGPDSTVGVGGSDSTIDIAGTAAQPPRASQPDTRTDYASLELIPPEHYVVNEQLARGGMGRVTRARDRRLGRDVAIKSLVRNTPELAARLEREARITARLQHPAIVDVHEAGMWPGGEPFYAMELVTGRPFGEAIAKTKTLAERLGLLPNVIAVADALAYAHAQKIIHRDLKPSNVLVGEYGETVVIDWGLAKDLAGGAPEPVPDRTPAATPEETVAGSIMGTPAYMPPEQAAGKPVDERADVYALGAMLYHVLAGVPPYIGDTSDAVLAAVAAGPPRAIAERAPGAPSDLITIVSKAMAYDARDRYPTARELADDLKKFQTGQLVGSHRYTMWQLVKRWLRRYRAAASIAGVLLVALAIVSIVGIRGILRERAAAEEQAQLAEQQRGVAEREAERARKAEAQVQSELDQLKAEQAARTRAEAEARAKGTEAEMSKEEALAALKRAENEKALAEQQRHVAEQESQRAKEAEARAETAAAAEKKTREEAERLYKEEKARVKALEEAKAKGITTTLPK
jgi:hypothetical protein